MINNIIKYLAEWWKEVNGPIFDKCEMCGKSYQVTRVADRFCFECREKIGVCKYCGKINK